MLKRQSTVGFPGANISDQSQACETRSCLFLYLCSEVDICTDVYTAHCCFCITFKNHFFFISEPYIISKSYGGPYKKHIIVAHVLQQTTPCLPTTAVPTQVSQGLISAIKAGRVKQGRVCFCVLASESTSVLIYILNTVHTVLFCITLKIQRAVHHFQVTR